MLILFHVTEGDNNVTVVMDTRLTPELIEEGFVSIQRGWRNSRLRNGSFLP